MMARGDRVEPGVARDDHLLHALPEAQHRVVAARLLGVDEQAEFHGILQKSPSPPPGAERLGEVGEPSTHAHLTLPPLCAGFPLPRLGGEGVTSGPSTGHHSFFVIT